MKVELRIRHGTSLTLRNVTFYVATKHVPDPLLRRPLLVALGVDAKELLAAASDKYSGSVDAEEILQDIEYATGSIAHVVNTSGLYHSQGAVMEDADDDSPYIELGLDTDTEIQTAFDQLVNDTLKEGISKEGSGELRHMLEEYRDVFRLRLGKDLPAKLEPM